MLAAKDELFTRPSGGYTIARSVRLRSSASANLTRTLTTPTNNKIFTFSAWIKFGILGSTEGIFCAPTTGTTQDQFRIEAGGSLSVYWSSGGGGQLTTTQVFRDPSAWYHIILNVDTTQATSTNRVKLYVNGVQVTSFSTASYPSQNYSQQFNSAVAHDIGGPAYNGTLYFDGYLTEINFIDGQALTPSSFGTTNTTTGVWQPAKYTGTYGTNGFYLNFSDNSSNTATTIGKDYSGNGNNWTPNNISVTAGVTYDSMVDSPTVGATSSNYAVLNPLDVANTGTRTIQAGNLDINTSSGSGGARSTFQLPTTGKWYFEGQYVSGTWSGNKGFGIGTNTSDISGNVIPTGCVTYNVNGQKTTGGAYSAYGSSYTTTDTVGIAVDQGAGTVTFYKNSTSQGAITHGLSVSNLFPLFVDPSSVASVQSLNFGQRPFANTPPTGYVALNTYNLPDSTITNGAAYMNAVARSGTGATATVAIAFEPDFIWSKCRSNAVDNLLFDDVRGLSNVLFSNLPDPQDTSNVYAVTTSSSGYGFGSNNGINGSGRTYVDWVWKKGASSGFDIVSQTLATTGINTITHSLNAVPTMVLAKKTSGTEQWLVYQSSGTTQSQYLGLNTTAAVATSANLWGSSAFTSSQIYFNGTSGNTYVFYIFAPVAGYSAFGGYTGNGSTDGTFVYTGFRPRFVMLKRTDSTGAWTMVDSSRNPYNVEDNQLYANYASAEAGASNTIDALSNGFKLREVGSAINASGGTYIYMAFAENPFKNALAR